MAISFGYQSSKYKLNKGKKIVEWILLVAYLEQCEVQEIEFVFCTDSYLKKLNEKFLKHRTYTDIITFDYSNSNNISAEIYISLDRVKANAKSFSVPFEEELLRVMIHGVLHCIGYNDKTNRSQSIMRMREDKYLQLLSEL